MGNSIQRPAARFEDFEVNLETGEVWKAGRPLKIQDKPCKVLSALLERPGQIVSREELRQLIWPENSVGDFDHAINLALAKLRATLGDSADVPHLIPRRGYRFIAPLREQTEPKTPSPRVAVWLPTLRAAIIPALLVAAVSLGALARRNRFLDRAAQPQIKPLAVLPLENLSGDPAQEYFADGMTDELTTMLAKNSSLLITSRTSVMQYKA